MTWRNKMRPGRATLCGLAAIVPAALVLRLLATAYRARLLAAAALHHQHSITGTLAVGFVAAWLISFTVLWLIAWAFGRARRPRVQVRAPRGGYGGYGGEW